MLSGEIFSPTRLLFQYMKALSNIDKLRASISPKMTYIITFLDKNGKYAVYIGGDINGIYIYLDIIGAPKILTTSGQRSHHFIPSSSINNDTASIHPLIADICTKQKSICECCGRIGHKSDACIICGPQFLPLLLRRKINQFNAIHGDEPNEPPK